MLLWGTYLWRVDLRNELKIALGDYIIYSRREENICPILEIFTEKRRISKWRHSVFAARSSVQAKLVREIETGKGPYRYLRRSKV